MTERFSRFLESKDVIGTKATWRNWARAEWEGQSGRLIRRPVRDALDRPKMKRGMVADGGTEAVRHALEESLRLQERKDRAC